VAEGLILLFQTSTQDTRSTVWSARLVKISGFRVVSQMVCLWNSSTSGEQNGRVPDREKAGFRIGARNSFYDNRFAGSGECRLYVRQWFHRTPSECRIIESAMVIGRRNNSARVANNGIERLTSLRGEGCLHSINKLLGRCTHCCDTSLFCFETFTRLLGFEGIDAATQPAPARSAKSTSRDI
jgi:hypothetical protein